MKKVGLVGGISWVSTLDYYRLINEQVNQKLGGLNFAECLIYSLNFSEVQKRTWENAYEPLFKACKSLQLAGAEALALCANTAHLYAEQLEHEIGLPIIHIVEATAHEVNKQGLKRVALLGTRFTMEMDFYKMNLKANGLDVMVPSQQETRDYIQHTLKDELGKGIISPATKQEYLRIANELKLQGAEGIILGCTEIPLLLNQSDLDLPVFDTTSIHVSAIVDFMVS